MIIIDMNQVITANIFAMTGSKKKPPGWTEDSIYDVGLMRHMTLNSIKTFKNKFSNQYGNLVLAYDAHNLWRKDVFPFYKAGRKKAREESLINWKSIYANIETVKDEIHEHMPYKVIRVDKCEADDIIGTIVHKRLGNNSPLKIKPTLIISADQDFVQLQTYSNVTQYDQTRKKAVTREDPSEDLFEHILEGDRIDGIPNVLSDDNVFVSGGRQNKLTKKIKSKIREDIAVAKYYERNRQLIDLSCVPDPLQEKILAEFDTPIDPAQRSKIFPYFMNKKLKQLMESIQEF